MRFKSEQKDIPRDHVCWPLKQLIIFSRIVKVESSTRLQEYQLNHLKELKIYFSINFL